ncbi:MAG: hypothetical protein CBC79_03115 [Gammaproteobacteria bacterium TMED119]|nr:MAG: hypothetical protein CBC79_03115 [Gammaproteobacteria bacterium TMED119]|tara:strand:- start:1964 stop:3889 length:1926 start_codon:yes stop_codon:yes gene_type:complete
MKNQLKILSLLTSQLCLTAAADSLPELTVSASRTPLPSQQIAGAIDIIDAQDIAQQHVDFVSDALLNTPALGLSHNGGPGKLTQLRIRGAEANHTLVMIDGIEANDIARGSEFDFAHLTSCGIERIEILRGPQSSLWGSDALSGVVSVESKRGLGPVSIDSSASGGSYGTRQNCTGIRAANQQHAVSVYGSYYDTDGTNISDQGAERDGYNNQSLSVRYDFEPSDIFSMKLIAKHYDISNDTDDFATNPDYSQYLVDADRKNEVIQNYARMSASLDSFSGRLNQQLGFAITDTNNKVYENGTHIEGTLGEKMKMDYQASVFFATDSTEHALTVAHEREYDDFKQRGTDFTYGDPNHDQEVQTNSYIAEYRLGLHKNLYLSASLRRDNNDDFDDSNTHRVTALYTPNEFKTRLHVAQGTGVKNPTFTERFGFFSANDQFIGNPDLEPETSQSWEFGVNHEVTPKLNVSAIYFREKLKNEINGFASTAQSGVYTAVNLDGDSHRKGLELALTANPLERLQIVANFTHVDSKQPGTDANRELRVPINTANVIADLELIAHKSYLNLKVNYVGEQIDTDFGVSPSVRRELDDYTLVSLAASYKINQHISIEGRIENLLDASYEDVIGYQTQGRQGFVGINFNQQR